MSSRRVYRATCLHEPKSAADGLKARLLRYPNSPAWDRWIHGVLAQLATPEAWCNNVPLREQYAAEARDAIDFWVQADMLGTVIAYVSTQPPKGTLRCNGSTHQRADYPRLYDALDPAYIIDANTFETPDLEGRFLWGALNVQPTADTGGATSVTLTTAQIPAHTHTTAPHTHTEGIAGPTAITIGPGAPAPSALPAAGVTGPATVSVNAAGGGDAHDNMPPYHAVRYAIIAY